MKVEQIHCIAGLPGSGKTFFGRELAEKLGGQLIDDIMYVEDIDIWGDERVLVLTDPFFCEPAVRTRAERKLREIAPGAIIKWYFFENDVERCRENVVLRNDGRRVEGSLKRFSKTYRIPEGVEVIPVWRP